MRPTLICYAAKNARALRERLDPKMTAAVSSTPAVARGARLRTGQTGSHWRLRMTSAPTTRGKPDVMAPGPAAGIAMALSGGRSFRGEA